MLGGLGPWHRIWGCLEMGPGDLEAGSAVFQGPGARHFQGLGDTWAGSGGQSEL